MKHAPNGQEPNSNGRKAAPDNSSAAHGRRAAHGRAALEGKGESPARRKASALESDSAERGRMPGAEASDSAKVADSAKLAKGGVEKAASRLLVTDDGAVAGTAAGAAAAEVTAAHAGAATAAAAAPAKDAPAPDPAAYPYGTESMLEISASSNPATPHQQFRENPRVIYPNGEALSRPLTIPDSARAGVVALVLAACLVAAGMLYLYFDTTMNEPKRQQMQLEEQLSKDVSLALPSLISLVELDDASIDAQLKSTGATFYDRKPVGSGDVYETIKLPDDMTLVDAGVLYATGVSNLTATQAVSLLNGSWDLKVDRKSGVNMSLHYADFESGDLESAISSAIAAEDLARGGITDSGDDDGFGNAYSTGTIMISGETYSWTVSAVALSEVYSVSGMPDDAVYVGIRVKHA